MQLFQYSIDQASHAVFWMNRAGGFSYVNDQACRSLGYTRVELLRLHLWDIDPLFPKDLWFSRWVGYQRDRRGGEEHLESVHRRKDGTTFPVEVMTKHIWFGDFELHVAYVLDITERKRAEEALREQEEWFRTVFEHASDGMCFVSGGGEIVLLNESFAAMHGYQVAELLNKNLTELGTPESNRLIPERMRRLEAGESLTFEVDHQHRNGQQFALEVTANRVRVGGKEYILASHRDITERKQAELALRTSEAAFRSLFEAGPAAVATLVDRKFQRVNALMSRITGYAEAGLLGQSTRILYAADAEFERVGRELYGAMERDGFGMVEARHRRENGEVYDVLLCARPLDPKTPAKALVLTLLDITERKRADEALRESMMRLQTIITGAPIVIYSFDRQGIFTLSAGKGLAGMGLQPGEAVGRSVTDLYGNRPDILENLRRCLAGETFTAQLDLGNHTFEIYHSPLHDQHGAYDGTIGVMVDVTERKQAEAAFERARLLLEAVLEQSPVPLLVMSTPDLVMRYINRAALDFLGVSDGPTYVGLTAAEIQQRQTWRYLHPDGTPVDPAHLPLARALRGQATRNEQFSVSRKDGTQRWGLASGTPVYSRSGKLMAALLVFPDITEHKQLEANFLRAQRMEGIGALAGGIAHDLNNILQPILMTVPILIETSTDPENRELLDTVGKCAQRGADIIRQLLTFARGTPGTRVPLPVRHLMNDVDKILRETFPRNLQLIVQAPKDLWPVMGDATQIHQALMNLCVNGRDAMPDGGRLTLEAKNLTVDETFASMKPEARPGAYVCLRVTDTGMGIPAEHLDRIFDPFFTTKEIGKGTGLGLATVLGIVRGHGGFVRVNSHPGQGTTFELYLPASPEATVAARPRSETLLPRADNELILVVDDEASVRGVIQHTLEKHGYRVVTAAEGIEAVALFDRHRAEIRAVLTDMMMPGMDGPALVLALRQREPQLPILGMTGVGEQADIKGLKGLGLPELLTKPFTSTLLLDTLYQTLAATRQPGSNAGK